MKLKLMILFLIEASLLSSLVCSGCTTEERYYSETAPNDYIILKSDGTYLVVQEKVDTFGGDWVEEEHKIILLLPYGSVEFTKTTGGLRDYGGELWTKR
ncbi:MAG: hypothetical protein JXA38_02725 [Methanosarcinaceae archaeon]|nr:hypothetical protein [Methanosarcinaceae archaeon]